MPGLTSENSSCRNPAGNDLRESTGRVAGGNLTRRLPQIPA
jgi:hypothetical protein